MKIRPEHVGKKIKIRGGDGQLLTVTAVGKQYFLFLNEKYSEGSCQIDLEVDLVEPEKKPSEIIEESVGPQFCFISDSELSEGLGFLIKRINAIINYLDDHADVFRGKK